MKNIRELENKIKMFNSVFEGASVTCPRCGKGKLKGDPGHRYIACSNPLCNFWASFYLPSDANITNFNKR